MSLSSPKKKYSQNFLTDSAVIHSISQFIAPKSNDAFVEVGPGEGALTDQILPYCAHYTGLEIDSQLIPILNNRFSAYNHFNMLLIDALKYEYGAHEPQPYRLIGNLPYHISSPLIIRFIRNSLPMQDMHLMFQKEVAERICATKGRSRGRLSLMVQFYCDVEYLLTIGAQSFSPAPDVESAFIRLTPKENSRFGKDFLDAYENIVKLAFSKKRKTLYNNLKSIISTAELQQLDIDPQRRAETLSVEEMTSICQLVENNK